VSCPPGYVLSPAPLQDYTTCECDTHNPIVVDCNGRNIVIRVSWAAWALVNYKAMKYYDTLVY